jgi:bacterioferritin-associated ferredoxin
MDNFPHNSCHQADNATFSSSCERMTGGAGCSGRMACYCLGITEADVTETIVALQLRTVREIRRHTGAGDGCTACHQVLKQLLEAHSSSSPEVICSVR